MTRIACQSGKGIFFHRRFPFVFKITLLPCLLLMLTYNGLAQSKATIREYTKTFTTYPFSDPDPIPNPASLIYPYFRYDGFTEQSIQKQWKVVELENDWIKITILPEIGGKVWSAIEKATGKSFLYNNEVIKFRDIAMRGPWTSGGLEANYGIIGHTPNCATPVDYITLERPDGSVSCLIGVMDLLSGSVWRLEINVPKDKAYFTTSSFWYNQTELEQPYYSWMNAGIKAKGNLQFIYPGTHYLGHEGEYSDWPINRENGHDISFYEQNNFGSYKSYHVFGKYSEFYGAYWHDDHFGMGRYSSRDDKPGKKIWIWGLSPQGMIWERLLSDTNGQYVEVQSGRLFNQSAEGSTFTPFKHLGFSPYAADDWKEYWFPVKDTRGFVKANPYGALNIKPENGLLKIFFSPLQSIKDELTISDGAKNIYSKSLKLDPLQVFSDSLPFQGNANRLVVRLGDKMVYDSDPAADTLARPLNMPADFDWNGVYGLYLQGKENIRQRFYPAAEEKLKGCLEKDPNYLPALDELGALQYRNMDYSAALSTTRKALSIDTYDGAANFYYGLINAKLGNEADSRDGFDIAALDITYRSAAMLELAKTYLRKRAFDRAIDYAGKCLQYNQQNLEAYRVEAMVYRLQHQEQKAVEVLARIQSIDMLDHFSRFEKWLWHPGAETERQFVSLIRNELPQQIYLDLGIWYHDLGCDEEALKLFSMAPAGDEINCWKAFLSHQPLQFGKEDMVSAFAYRAETAEVLQSLLKENNDWRLKYQLALIWWSRDNQAKARELFSACGSEPAYAPFYAAKAALFPEEAETNLKKAIDLDKEQWRFYKLLANFYFSKNENQQALNVTSRFYKEHPKNYIIGMLYARALMANAQYAAADALLSNIHIIPFEGATEGYTLYHKAKLMQALQAIDNRQYKKALAYIRDAQSWPDNLGSGKPYDEDIDLRVENWLNYYCYTKAGNTKIADAYSEKIVKASSGQHKRGRFLPANSLISLQALERSGDSADEQDLLNRWLQKNPSDKTAQLYRQQLDSRQPVSDAQVLEAIRHAQEP